MLLSALSCHLGINVLLGSPKGSMTLCATSDPATGKPEGSSKPICPTLKFNNFRAIQEIIDLLEPELMLDPSIYENANVAELANCMG